MQSEVWVFCTDLLACNTTRASWWQSAVMCSFILALVVISHLSAADTSTTDASKFTIIHWLFQAASWAPQREFLGHTCCLKDPGKSMGFGSDEGLTKWLVQLSWQSIQENTTAKKFLSLHIYTRNNSEHYLMTCSECMWKKNKALNWTDMKK